MSLGLKLLLGPQAVTQEGLPLSTHVRAQLMYSCTHFTHPVQKQLGRFLPRGLPSWGLILLPRVALLASSR